MASRLRVSHEPRGAATHAFTGTEIEQLERNVIRRAQLGGYLAFGDTPPGNTVMWRGVRRPTDTLLGYELALERIGKCKITMSLLQESKSNRPLDAEELLQPFAS